MKTTLSIAFAALILVGSPQAQADNHEGGEEATEWESAPAVEETASADSAGMPAAGTVGIGTVGTLVGIRGAELEYWMDGFMLEGILGLNFNSPDVGDANYRFGLGAGGFYPLASGGGSALMIGGRLLATIGDNGADSQFELDIEIPVRAQLWLGKHFALHMEAGAVVQIVSDDTSPVNGLGKGVGFSFGNAGGVLSRMGATMYF